MKYQVSLEGMIKGKHTQLNFIDVESYRKAMEEVSKRKHLPYDPHEQYIALLFSDKKQAIADGIPFADIEDVWNDGRLFRYKAKVLNQN